jgi:hypothetical protein
VPHSASSFGLQRCRPLLRDLSSTGSLGQLDRQDCIALLCSCDLSLCSLQRSFGLTSLCERRSECRQQALLLDAESAFGRLRGSSLLKGGINLLLVGAASVLDLLSGRS